MRVAMGDVTAQSCTPYMCGADPFNISARLTCAQSDIYGVKSCLDPDCKPYCPNQQVQSLVERNAQIVNIPAKLTPQNIVAPMPDITRVLQPIATSSTSCSWWSELNQMIADNPFVAVLILGGTFLALKGKR